MMPTGEGTSGLDMSAIIVGNYLDSGDSMAGPSRGSLKVSLVIPSRLHCWLLRQPSILGYFQIEWPSLSYLMEIKRPRCSEFRVD